MQNMPVRSKENGGACTWRTRRETSMFEVIDGRLPLCCYQSCPLHGACKPERRVTAISLGPTTVIGCRDVQIPNRLLASSSSHCLLHYRQSRSPDLQGLDNSLLITSPLGLSFGRASTGSGALPVSPQKGAATARVHHKPGLAWHAEYGAISKSRERWAKLGDSLDGPTSSRSLFAGGS